MLINRRAEHGGFSVRITEMAFIAAGLLAAAVAEDAQAKNELVRGTGFSTSLTAAPVMNNDGQVAYIMHSSIVTTGGVGASFINLDDITGNTFVRIATAGTDVPGGSGQFDSFSVDGQNSIGLRLNDIGQGGGSATVMFHAFLDGLGVFSSSNQGIYTGNGTFQGEVARKGDAYNVSGDEYVSFFAMGIDSIGETGYLASVDPAGLAGIEDAIFRKQGAVLQVVDSGDTIPGGGGQFSNIGFFQGTNQIIVNDRTSQVGSEKIAFYSSLSGTSSGANDYGVYRASAPGQIVQMARGDQTLFGGKISNIGHPDMNDDGWVAYRATLFNGPSDDGIFVADTSGAFVTTLAIALEGNATPGGFTFTGFDNEPDVNNNNWVAFLGTFNGPSNHNNGLYRASTGPSLTTITEEGDFPDIPGLNNRGFVGTFGDFTLNDSNQTAFVANIDNGSGGSVKGIYVGLGAGKKPQEVARVGQTLDGKTIANLKVNLGVDVGGSTGFNNLTQVAYLAEFTNGSAGIYRFTPTMKIAVASADTLMAAWDNANDWNLGVIPGDPIYDVVVGDGAEAVLGGTVAGPTSAALIGDLTVGYPTIPNQPNPTVDFVFREPNGGGPRNVPLLTVDGTAEILSSGELTIQGDDGLTLVPALQVVGNLSNLGRIELQQQGKIGGEGTLTNLNMLLGDGVVCPSLDNRSAGLVLVSNGEGLRFGHTETANTNEGMIVVETDAALVFAGDLVNRPAGTVAVDADARLTVQNLLSNGAITGQGALIVVGDLAGTGLFGDGRADVAGQVRPGDRQVGPMTFGGDLLLGPAAGLEVEVGGLSAGIKHDYVAVAERASLDGTLDVALVNGFTPSAGNAFEILTAASLLGNFDTANLPPLPGDLQWFVNYHDTSVELVSTYPGDYNSDGLVGQADLDLVLLNWGNTSPPAPAGWLNDLPDGLIGQVALDNVLLHWGAGATPIASVPEPTTGILLVLGTVALRFRRHAVVS